MAGVILKNANAEFRKKFHGQVKGRIVGAADRSAIPR